MPNYSNKITINADPVNGFQFYPSESIYAPTSSAPATAANFEITVSETVGSNLISNTELNPYLRIPIFTSSFSGNQREAELVIRFFTSSHFLPVHTGSFKPDRSGFKVLPVSRSLYYTGSSGARYMDTLINPGTEGATHSKFVRDKIHDLITGSSYQQQGFISASKIDNFTCSIDFVGAKGVTNAPISYTGSLLSTKAFSSRIKTAGSGFLNFIANTQVLPAASSSFNINFDKNDPTSVAFTTGTASLGFIESGRTNANLMYFSSSGAVGVKTDDPKADFEISGSVKGDEIITKPTTGRPIKIKDSEIRFYETTQQDPKHADYSENKERARIKALPGSFNLVFEVSGSSGYTNSVYISQSGNIGFNTDDPQSAFDAVVDEAQFQKPGARKGLKINQEGNIESFDRDVNSATTGSEFILKYSRGVTINQLSLDTIGISVASDVAATNYFNSLPSAEQNAIFKKLESLGFITPPQAGDILGSIRFVAESGSIGALDERTAGETAAIKAVVSEGASDGVSSDLIFSVANKAGAAQQKLLLDSNDAHTLTGNLTLGGGILINGFVQSANNSQTYIDFLSPNDDDITFTSNNVQTLKLFDDKVVINPINANVDFRVDGDSNDNLIFADAGTEKVGIGTNSPGEKLEVVGNISASGDLSITNVSASLIRLPNGGGIYFDNGVGPKIIEAGNGLQFWANGAGSDKAINIDGNGRVTLFTHQGSGVNDLRIDKGGTSDNLFYVSGSGNVGIGTTTPSRPLHVKNTSAQTVAMFDAGANSAAEIAFSGSGTSGGTYVTVGAVGNDLSLSAGAAERIRVKSDGNVGIGTTTPSSPLHVSGSTSPKVIIEGNTGTQLLRLRRTDANAHFDISLEGNDLRFNPNTLNNSMNVLFGVSNGSAKVASRVGIGQPVPQSELDVSGSVIVTGDISSSGTGSFAHYEFPGSSGNITGHLIPSADATFDLGSTNSEDWNNLYVRAIDIFNQRVNISSDGTTATFADHSSVGDGFQFKHLNQEILRLGNNGDYTANFSANITASGNISASGEIFGNSLKSDQYLYLGADANFYRDGVNIIRTDDVFHANGDIHIFDRLVNRSQTSNYIEFATNKQNFNVSQATFTGDITASGNISSSGTVTANSFVGTFTGAVTGDATGLTGTPDISVRHITASGNISSSGKITVGSDGNGSDFKVFGEKANTFMLYDASEEQLTIKHPRDQAGLAIFTTSSASPTGGGQIRVGRDGGQYIGLKTLDRDAHFIHRQDETDSGTARTYFEIWDSSHPATGSHHWAFRSADGSGENLETRMLISSSGNVGIGTTAPTAPLHIDGGTNGEVLKIEADANPYIRWVENGTNVGFLQFLGDHAYLSNMSNGSFFFRTNNTDKMTILSGGNVGIGTTSPGEKLTVEGDISASGDININNNSQFKGKHTNGNEYGLLTLTSGNQIKVGGYDYTSAGVIFGGGDNTQFLIGSSEVMRMRSTGLEVTGHITASGEISASSVVASDIYINDNIYHNGNATTRLNFEGDNLFRVIINGSEKILYSTSNTRFSNNDILLNSVDISGSGNSTGSFSDGRISGKLGIGTASPSEKLHVYNPSDVNDDVKLKIENDFSGKNAVLVVDGGSSGDAVIQLAEASSVKGIITYDGGTDVLKIINDGSTATEHLAISASGNVGIGTFSPDEKLEVVGNISASGDLRIKDIYLSSVASSPGKIIGTENSGKYFRLEDGGGFGEWSSYSGFKFRNTSGTNVATLSNTGDLTIIGTLTAQEFHTEFVSASILFESGSTKFGDTQDDVHSFTGSLSTSGSIFQYGDNYNVEIGDGAVIRGSNHFQVEAQNSYLNVMAPNNAIYYRAGANHVFRNGNGSSTYMTIDTSGGGEGNVGIGNTSPPEALTVEGNISSSGTGSFAKMGIGNVTQGSYFLNVEGYSRLGGVDLLSGVVYADSARINNFQDKTNNTFSSIFHSGASRTITFMTSGSNRMILDSDGNLGIGNLTPSEKLTVEGDISASGDIHTQTVVSTTTNTPLKLYGGSAQDNSQGFIKLYGQNSQWGSVHTNFGYDEAGNGRAFWTTDGDKEHMKLTAESANEALLIVNGTISSSNLITDSNITASGLHVKNTGTAMLTLEGDSDNSGDSGEEDGIINFTHDSGFYGFKIASENHAGKSALHFEEKVNGSFKNRLILHQDGGVGVGEGMDNPGTYAFAVSGSKMIIRDAGDVELILNADTDNVDETHDTNLTFKQDATHNMLHIGSNGTAASPQYNGLIDNSAFIIGGNGHSGGIKLQFGVNHTASMALTTTGLGIGTNTPGRELTVIGDIGVKNSGRLYLWNDHDSNYIQYNHWQGSASSGMKIINTSGTGDLTLGAGNADRLFVSSSGNVGIGTTDPQYAKLQVNGTTLFQGASQIQGDLSLRGNVKDLNHDSSAFVTTKTRYTGGSELGLDYDFVRSINASNGGNVGIGTTAAPEKLTVEGNISSSGGITAHSFTGSFSGTIIGDATGLTGTPDITVGNITASSLLVTGSATDLLHVKTSTVNKGFIKIESTHVPRLKLKSSTETMEIIGDAVGGFMSGGGYIFNTPTSRDTFHFAVNNTPKMTLEAGRLGIGEGFLHSNVPVGLLDVSGSAKMGVIGTDNHIFSGSLDIQAGGLSGTATSPLKIEGGGGQIRFDSTNTIFRAYSFNLQTNSSFGGSGNSALFASYNYGGSTPRVGIGTTAPSERLTVEGNISASGNIYISDVELKGSDNKIRWAGSNNNRIQYNSSTGLTYSAFQQHFKVYDGVSNYVEYMTILNGGNIGIGTTSPGEKLEVRDGNLIVSSSTSEIVLGTVSGKSRIFTNSSKDIRISTATTNDVLFLKNSNGNVGIGTTSPTEKLHIHQGNILLSGSSSHQYKAFPTSNTYASSIKFDNNELAYVWGGGVKAYFGNSHQLSFGDRDPSNSGANKTVQDPLIGKTGTTNNTGSFHIKTADIARIFVSGSGNVGIGTTSPFLPLHVEGDARIDGNLLVGNCASTNTPAADFHIKSSGTDAKLRIEDLDDANLAYDILVNSGSGLTITETTDATSRIHIQQGTGNVGIGTASPGEKLEVAGKAIIRRTGTATAHSDTDLLVTDATAAGSTAAIQILGGNTGFSNLQFSDTDAYAQGGIIYSHSTDTMTIKAGASTAITITGSNQNVGIGTASPGEKLDINGVVRVGSGGAWATSTGAVQLTYDSSTAQGVLSTYYDTTSLRLGAGTSQKTGITINGQSNANGNNITFRVGNSDRMFITGSTGNVGIGTTTPTHKLHIADGSDSFKYGADIGDGFDGVLLTGDAPGVKFAGPGDDFIIGKITAGVAFFNSTDSNYKMILNDDGNLGIGTGTTAPPEKLTVEGNISASGTGYFNQIGIRTVSPNSEATLHVSADDTSPTLSSTTPTDVTAIFSNSDTQYGTMFATDGSGKGYIQQRRVNAATYYDLLLQPHGGKVGIGTTSPGVALEIGNISGGHIRLADAYSLQWASANNRIFNQSNDTVFVNNASESVRIKGSGNVGIGTDSPPEKLTVEGNISASGDVSAYAFRAPDHTLRFRLANNSWDSFSSTANGQLQLASGGANDRGELYLHSDHGSTPRAGVVTFENEAQQASYLFTDASQSLKMHTSDPGEDDSAGYIVGVPKVEYYTVTSSALRENISMTLPNSLTYKLSTDGYEYLEVFTDGIRLNRTIDYAEVDSSTVRYLISIPSQSIITYKSLRTV